MTATKPPDTLLTKKQQAQMLNKSAVSYWRLEHEPNNGLPTEVRVGPRGRKMRLQSEMLQYVERCRVKP